MVNRREFLQWLSIASAAGILPGSAFSQKKFPTNIYEVPAYGSARLLHFTDCHAQLLPVFYREPNVNIGIGKSQGKPPHIVGTSLLDYFGLPSNGALEYAFTYLNFEAAAEQYGKIGGFAHLATLIKQLRTDFGEQNCLLLDGGDTWQGSGTAYKTNGMDMVKACNLLGVDIMTGHWEFTYHDHKVLENIEAFSGEFLAQNIKAKEEALFDGIPVYDEDSGHVFKPYTIKELANSRLAIIGQAFPYTPVANPKRFIPNWTFGINESDLQSLINDIQQNHKPDVVVLLSHNGADVDLQMAAQVSGIDVILGGHTHDGIPNALEVKNAGGITLVTNAGSNGKFLGVMDLDIRNGKLQGYQYKLLPVFSSLITPDHEMQMHIHEVRKPHESWLTEELGIAETTLYRRGNFSGTFDQLICNALREQNDTQISLSPGFRWGTSLPANSTITMEHVLEQTCMTYPETYRREMTGKNIKLILEDVCDNLFNPNPYYQQGGDMVRVGGMNYTCDPNEQIGQRISNMALDDGSMIEPEKSYTIAGWATVNDKAPGPPVWEQVASHIKEHKTIQIDKLNSPKLIGVSNNPGYSKA